MKISLTPVRLDKELTLSRKGDVLEINGEAFDLSGIPEGARLPAGAVTCEWLASDIERINGALHLTLILPHGANAPQETTFPAPLDVTEDGPIELPPYDTPRMEDIE
jgi:hypothetical protein